MIPFKQSTKQTKEIRIKWRIPGILFEGGGLWNPISEIARLQNHVADLCNKHGPGTHWIEEREA